MYYWKETVFAIALLLFGAVFSVCSQESVADSLIQIPDKTDSDSTNAEVFMQFARSFDFNEREKSIEYFTKSLEFIADKQRKAEILDTLGFYNWQLGNFNEAIHFYKKSESLFLELNDSLWLGRVYNTLGVCYWGLGKGNEALRYYQKAATIRKATGDNSGTSRVLNNIGIVYRNWGLHNQAIRYHREALANALIENNNFVVAYTYSNIGNYYDDIARYDSALYFYNLGQERLLEEEAINADNSYFSEYFGNIYLKTGKPDVALYHYLKSLRYANRINNKNNIAIAGLNLGKTFFKLNLPDSARRYIQFSYQLSSENHYDAVRKDNLLLMAEMAEKEGNIRQALTYFKRASALKDSLINNEKIVKFNELQNRFFNEQQEKENDLLRKDIEIKKLSIERQKNIRIILIVSGLFILLIMFFIVRNRATLKKLNQKLKNSERDLIIANADKDKFFTIIAHDLKSPFTGLLGLTEMLHNNFGDFSTEKTKQIISLLNNSTQKVYALLESLLQWAQIQTGRMEYRPENVELQDSCEKVVELHSTNAFNKKIEIVNRFASETIVFADPKSVETVLRNLVSNALKFTHPGGKVVISSLTNENEVVISVADSGIGMSKESVEKLFRIDVPVASRGTGNEPGTGLGLILCKELIEKNNGKIWVESEPGKGSTFYFSLPKTKNTRIAERL